MFGLKNIAEVGVEGEWQWERSSLGRKMAALESSLRCAICSEYFTNPHSLNCGHSFCSECIRRHLDQTINPTTSGICPSCRATAQVSHLRPEKTLVEVMSHFKAGRAELLGAVLAIPYAAAAVGEEGVKNKPRTGTSITRKIAQGHFHKQSREIIKKALEKLTEGCAVSYRIRTDGDRDILEKRHKDFVHLHNAQLDSPDPLTLEQVVAEVHRRESARTVEAMRSGKKSVDFEKLKNGEITKEANDSFAELIKKAKLKKAEANKATISTAAEIGADTSSTGNWRMVKSRTVGKIFYYNIKTKIGQFGCPPEIKKLGGHPVSPSEIADDIIEPADPFLLYDEDSHPIRIDSESPVAAGSPDKAVVSASCGKTTEESLVEEKSGLDSFKSPSPLQIRDPITDERVAAAAKEDEDINCALQRSLEEVNEEGILLIHAQDESVRALDDVVAVSHHEADASWSCLQCTYLNEGVAATCDMCNSVRPRAKSARVSSTGSSQPVTASQVSFETPWSSHKLSSSGKRDGSSSAKSTGSSSKRPRRS